MSTALVSAAVAKEADVADGGSKADTNSSAGKKQRDRWTDTEHNLFLEALRKYGRDWRSIEAHVGTKTAIQIRSHAQKFFAKVQKAPEIVDFQVPPPRMKRKPGQGDKDAALTRSDSYGQASKGTACKAQAAASAPSAGGRSAVPSSSHPHLPQGFPQWALTSDFSWMDGATGNLNELMHSIAVAALTSAAVTAHAVVTAAGSDYINKIQKLSEQEEQFRFLQLPLASAHLSPQLTGDSRGLSNPSVGTSTNFNSGALTRTSVKPTSGLGSGSLNFASSKVQQPGVTLASAPAPQPPAPAPPAPPPQSALPIISSLMDPEKLREQLGLGVNPDGTPRKPTPEQSAQALQMLDSLLNVGLSFVPRPPPPPPPPPPRFKAADAGAQKLPLGTVSDTRQPPSSAPLAARGKSPLAFVSLACNAPEAEAPVAAVATQSAPAACGHGSHRAESAAPFDGGKGDPAAPQVQGRSVDEKDAENCEQVGSRGGSNDASGGSGSGSGTGGTGGTGSKSGKESKNLAERPERDAAPQPDGAAANFRPGTYAFKRISQEGQQGWPDESNREQAAQAAALVRQYREAYEYGQAGLAWAQQAGWIPSAGPQHGHPPSSEAGPSVPLEAQVASDGFGSKQPAAHDQRAVSGELKMRGHGAYKHSKRVKAPAADPAAGLDRAQQPPVAIPQMETGGSVVGSVPSKRASHQDGAKPPKRRQVMHPPQGDTCSIENVQTLNEETKNFGLQKHHANKQHRETMNEQQDTASSIHTHSQRPERSNTQNVVPMHQDGNQQNDAAMDVPEDEEELSSVMDGSDEGSNDPVCGASNEERTGRTRGRSGHMSTKDSCSNARANKLSPEPTTLAEACLPKPESAAAARACDGSCGSGSSFPPDNPQQQCAEMAEEPGAPQFEVPRPQQVASTATPGPSAMAEVHGTDVRHGIGASALVPLEPDVEAKVEDAALVAGPTAAGKDVEMAALPS